MRQRLETENCEARFFTHAEQIAGGVRKTRLPPYRVEIARCKRLEEFNTEGKCLERGSRLAETGAWTNRESNTIRLLSRSRRWARPRLCARPSRQTRVLSIRGAAICYGQSALGRLSAYSTMPSSMTLSRACTLKDRKVHLPFDPAQIVENLRTRTLRERFRRERAGAIVDHPLVRKTYYAVRELMPVAVRKHFQKVYLGGWRKLQFPNWPVDFTVDTIHEQVLRLAMEAGGVRRVPFIWFWPQGAPSCLIMTHDVETAAGRDFTPELNGS